MHWNGDFRNAVTCSRARLEFPCSLISKIKSANANSSSSPLENVYSRPQNIEINLRSIAGLKIIKNNLTRVVYRGRFALPNDFLVDNFRALRCYKCNNPPPPLPRHNNDNMCQRVRFGVHELSAFTWHFTFAIFDSDKNRQTKNGPVILSPIR